MSVKRVQFYQITLATALLFNGCADDADPKKITFGAPQKVTITGYAGNIMEPFLSRDGTILFFNNLNSAPENTNLHWSTRVDDLTFQYKGEIQNINTEFLEGVATMDNSGILYFVSTRSYNQNFSTIYKTTFTNGETTTTVLVEGLSKNLPGWVNFDVEVNPAGNRLYFVDGTYDQNGGPYTANLVIAKKNGDAFERLSNSGELLKNINTDDLEYAACISSDELELYFTRIVAPISPSSNANLFVATRTSTDLPFDKPYQISSITGFVEAATISPDGTLLYYHKRENDKFVLYAIVKD